MNRSSERSRSAPYAAALLACPLVLAFRAPSDVPPGDDAALSPWCLADFAPLSYAPLFGFQAPAWSLHEDGLCAVQAANSQPTVLVSEFDLDQRLVEVELEVATVGDGDAVGLALGIEPGDATDQGARWWLVDWRRTQQTIDFPGGLANGSTATVGLALSEVRGVPSPDAFWGHVLEGDQGLVELARGAGLGSAPWEPGRTYRVRAQVAPDRLRVWVDGTLEIDVSGAFDEALGGGRLGLFNFSQGGAHYRVLTERVKASATSYGAGTPGALGVPELSASAPPVLGRPFALRLGNASGAATDACLFVTGAPGELETPLGLLLVQEPLVWMTVLHPFPAEGVELPFLVPNEPSLAGLRLYAQSTHTDAQSATGSAWSRGLELVIGE